MDVATVLPWQNPDWDAYVSAHPHALVYHTSVWCSIVRDIGGYEPICLVAREGASVRGILPLMFVKSQLTGRRLVALPFSDECPPLVDDRHALEELLGRARELVAERGAGYVEVRGAPHLDSDGDEASVTSHSGFEPLGFAEQLHFETFLLPLSTDTDAIRKTFSRTAVRQTINKSFRLGVTGRRGNVRDDLDAFYTLYAMNRKRHGIPPQPKRLFEMIFERMSTEPDALLYLVEHEERPLAALVTFRYRGVTYAKYEGVDDRFRHLLPIYALFWTSIVDAAQSGDRMYDWGRTASDNRGLCDFKSRWGTRREPLPYYIHPPGEGLSTVRRESLKYRLFTGTVKRLPLALATRLGARLFKHFG